MKSPRGRLLAGFVDRVYTIYSVRAAPGAGLLPQRRKARASKGLRICRLAAVLLAGALAAGCASPPQQAWESRLRGDTIVLLGELHDNPLHHRERLQVLRRAFASGWRPAIALEQLDRERQADIERARRDKPHDAQHVIDLAAPPKGSRGGNWNWDYYRPFIALALEFNVPLVAANLSSADISRVVRGGYAAVFDAQVQRELGLDRPLPRELQAAQEREIDVGHCNVLPAKLLPAMARGQMARDAVIAGIVAQHAALNERKAVNAPQAVNEPRAVNEPQGQGVVLIAGNGHVRRDIGVPYWFNAELRARTLAVGYFETGGDPAHDTAFDVVVRTARAERADPCIELRARFKK